MKSAQTESEVYTFNCYLPSCFFLEVVVSSIEHSNKKKKKALKKIKRKLFNFFFSWLIDIAMGL